MAASGWAQSATGPNGATGFPIECATDAGIVVTPNANVAGGGAGCAVVVVTRCGAVEVAEVAEVAEVVCPPAARVVVPPGAEVVDGPSVVEGRRAATGSGLGGGTRHAAIVVRLDGAPDRAGTPGPATGAAVDDDLEERVGTPTARAPPSGSATTTMPMMIDPATTLVRRADRIRTDKIRTAPAWRHRIISQKGSRGRPGPCRMP